MYGTNERVLSVSTSLLAQQWAFVPGLGNRDLPHSGRTCLDRGSVLQTTKEEQEVERAADSARERERASERACQSACSSVR
jgi:hypothetical protein